MPFHRTVLTLLAAATVGFSGPSPRITVLSGSRADGRATDLWLAILRRRLSPAEYDSVAVLGRSRSAEEEAWARLVRSRARAWPDAATGLLALFDSTRVDSIVVVLGDRGAEDAFTHDSLTIGMDLSALQRVYGNAGDSGHADLLDRLFRHELSHLLQKRWLARHPFDPQSPLEAAVLDEWEEGLGNYYSLSARWRAEGGVSAAALAELQPRFAARMSALACADSAAARPLLAGLASGPFDQKWGALPVALWLLEDLRTEPEALHRFAIEGPPAVWSLAARHLPGPLRDTVAAARVRARSCVK